MPLAGSRIKPKKYLAARSNMTGGHVAPFFIPSYEVTFAVGHVGLDRAIKVGSWRECRQHFGYITVAIFHPVFPP